MAGRWLCSLLVASLAFDCTGHSLGYFGYSSTIDTKPGNVPQDVNIPVVSDKEKEHILIEKYSDVLLGQGSSLESHKQQDNVESTNPEFIIDELSENGNSSSDALQERSDTGLVKGKPWGSHPLPPPEYYLETAGVNGVSWTAFFHDQAIAILLQGQDGTILNCTLLEVIQTWEQRAALEYLGRVMVLVPVPLDHMVHLVSLCGTVAPLPLHADPHDAQQLGGSSLWWFGSSALKGLLPGTLWCGMGDQAQTYHDLGDKAQLDSCCRAHDHCPVKLRPMMTKYGVTNYDFKTKSHCSCDLEFFRCLKAAGKGMAEVVGQVYFNYLGMECLEEMPRRPVRSRPHHAHADGTPEGQPVSPPENSPQVNPVPASPQVSPRLTCTRVDEAGGCRMWLPNPKGFTTRLAITKPHLEF